MTEAPISRVRVHRDRAVATVVLGTGWRRNALTATDWADLRSIFEALRSDQNLALTVVRGSASTFSSGADIEAWDGAGEAEVEANFALMEQALVAIESAPFPVIAVVEGIAAGAGCELALACDLQIASSSARVGMPIARLGILLSPAFAARMVARAGPSHTLEMIYSGRLLPAEEAVAAGLLTVLVADEDLDAKVDQLTRSIIELPIAATRAAKASVTAILAPIRALAASATPNSSVAYPDFKRGVSHFLDHD